MDQLGPRGMALCEPAVAREQRLHLVQLVGACCAAGEMAGEGARYIAHRDNDGGDDHTARRAWTCILYANEGWQPTDGGALRCYPRGCGEDGHGDGVVTVAPAAGTLVIFDSRRLLHEVLPAYAPPYAVTLWLEDAMGDS